MPKHKLLCPILPGTDPQVNKVLLTQADAKDIQNLTKDYSIFYKFMVIQNPYFRFLTWWDFRDMPFIDFLVWAETKVKHHCCQADFGEAFGINSYLYYENLPEDFRKIHALRNIKSWTPSKISTYSFGINEVRLIQKYSDRDFEQFGYTKWL